ncbi:lipopolysaccharide biosynthesis protein [Comamonas badia]|uniref:lipopolysaccharide biosynthesis protein n=1 Tax=Comamonas badia TaxID=265291 RepID=UPI0012EC5F1B|nr:oligosaccharide flippase family protein [Comamonas badia]
MNWNRHHFPLRWRPGQLARHGGVLLAWMLVRAGAQAATVILLARVLGASSYGAFVATIAVAGFVAPLVGLGLSNIVLRNGARDPTHLPYYFQRAARIWGMTLMPGMALVAALVVWLLPAGLPLSAMFAATSAEVAATTLTELRARQRQAEHQIGGYGAINAGLPLLRLVVLGLLVGGAGMLTLSDALWAYAFASMLYILLLMPGVRMPHTTSTAEPTEDMTLGSGLAFSLAALAMRLQGEFNKPILARLGTNLAGNYNIAQRAVDMASLPLMALQEALWPRLYAQANPLPQLRRSGLMLMALALLLGCGLWLTAPLLRWIVGREYDEAISVLRMLAWLPLLQVGRSLLNFHIIYCGRMALIGWACTLGGAASVLGVLAFVPVYGVSGAVLTSYAAEILMFVFLAYCTKKISRPRKI